MPSNAVPPKGQTCRSPHSTTAAAASTPRNAGRCRCADTRWLEAHIEDAPPTRTRDEAISITACNPDTDTLRKRTRCPPHRPQNAGKLPARITRATAGEGEAKAVHFVQCIDAGESSIVYLDAILPEQTRTSCAQS